MAIPIFLLPLLKKGLDLVANAAMAKGKDWLEEKTGVDLSKESLSEADFLTLREFEMEHEEELLRLKHQDNLLEKETKEMYLEDTGNARALQMVALKQEDPFAKRFVYWFALMWSLAAIAFVFAITFLEIPFENTRFADTVLGFVLGTIIAQIIAFFFGSSQGSKNKDAIKDQLLQKMVER